MSGASDELRRAAAAIREDAGPRSHSFYLAVADWLDTTAARADQILDTGNGIPESVVAANVTAYTEALVTARAYLGTEGT